MSEGPLALSRDGEAGQNYLCSGLELFFTQSRHAMETMAKLLRDGRPPSDVMAMTAIEDKRRGPYAPCPCGSGRKFKFCHGNNASRRPLARRAVRSGAPHDGNVVPTDVGGRDILHGAGTGERHAGSLR